ncbi:hypothetical protein ABSA28_00556 [Candidatus Hepatincolaceae symbiont of Richtersius coronifer]
MLNKTQNSILKLYKEDFSLNKTDLKETIFINLENQFKVTLDRNPDSNLSILVSVIADSIIKGKIEFLELINNLTNFFDSNKFDGYNSGSYAGLHQALLSLPYILDCNLTILSPGTIAIILQFKTQADSSSSITTKPTNERNLEVAQILHKYISIGILTAVPSSTLKLSNTINASTGQAITYNFCESVTRKFNFIIKYHLDYEQQFTEFDIEDKIQNAFLAIYKEKYNKIGKNFNVQDFYSLTKTLPGIKKLEITLQEIILQEDQPNALNSKIEIINTFTDTDIEIKDWEILISNDIKLSQGN